MHDDMRRRRRRRPFDSNENSTKINWLSEFGRRSERTVVCDSTGLVETIFPFSPLHLAQCTTETCVTCVHLQFKIPFSSSRKAHIFCVRFVAGVSMARHISYKRVIWRWALGVGQKIFVEQRKSCCVRFETSLHSLWLWANEFRKMFAPALQLRVAQIHGGSNVRHWHCRHLFFAHSLFSRSCDSNFTSAAKPFKRSLLRFVAN